jgi:hypothetical protein
MNSLLRLIKNRGILPLRPPVPEHVISEFELEAGFRLPPELRALYLMCDGIEFRKTLFRVMPFAEARQVREAFHRHTAYDMTIHFPLTENNDSDPFCVCCDGLLTGYIMHFAHGFGTLLAFRGLELFFEAVGPWLKRIDRTRTDLHQILPYDMQSPERTSHDIETGLKLLHQIQTGESGDEDAELDLFRYAVLLLSEAHVDKIAPFLEYTTTNQSQEVQQRFKEMNSPDAKKALRLFGASWRKFVKQCRSHLAPFEIEMAPYRSSIYKVRHENVSQYLYLDPFYPQRHHPDFWPSFIDHVKHEIETAYEKERHTKFVALCVNELKRAHVFEAGTIGYGGTINWRGVLHINLLDFYDERDQPDFLQTLVRRIRQMIAEAEEE